MFTVNSAMMFFFSPTTWNSSIFKVTWLNMVFTEHKTQAGTVSGHYYDSNTLASDPWLTITSLAAEAYIFNFVIPLLKEKNNQWIWQNHMLTVAKRIWRRAITFHLCGTFMHIIYITVVLLVDPPAVRERVLLVFERGMMPVRCLQWKRMSWWRPGWTLLRWRDIPWCHLEDAAVWRWTSQNPGVVNRGMFMTYRPTIL